MSKLIETIKNIASSYFANSVNALDELPFASDESVFDFELNINTHIPPKKLATPIIPIPSNVEYRKMGESSSLNTADSKAIKKMIEALYSSTSSQDDSLYEAGNFKDAQGDLSLDQITSLLELENNIPKQLRSSKKASSDLKLENKVGNYLPIDEKTNENMSIDDLAKAVIQYGAIHREISKAYSGKQMNELEKAISKYSSPLSEECLIDDTEEDLPFKASKYRPSLSGNDDDQLPLKENRIYETALMKNGPNSNPSDEHKGQVSDDIKGGESFAPDYSVLIYDANSKFNPGLKVKN